MQAGRMRYKLELLRPQSSTDRFGEDTPEWVPTGRVWAERVKMRGQGREEAGEHFPDYSVEFNIRDAHEVEENWRVRQAGGHEYTVTNIIPNRDRGMLTLVCVRVNE